MADRFKELLTLLVNGGRIAISYTGKRSVGVEVHQIPSGYAAGLATLAQAEGEGLIREGDVSPCKGGYCIPYVLTDKGIAAAAPFAKEAANAE